MRVAVCDLTLGEVVTVLAIARSASTPRPLRMVRLAFPQHDCIPVDDDSPAEPGCPIAVVLRWPAVPGDPRPWVARGRVRRMRFNRPDLPGAIQAARVANYADEDRVAGEGPE